jgi:hypothetical protein
VLQSMKKEKREKEHEIYGHGSASYSKENLPVSGTNPSMSHVSQVSANKARPSIASPTFQARGIVPSIGNAGSTSFGLEMQQNPTVMTVPASFGPGQSYLASQANPISASQAVSEPLPLRHGPTSHKLGPHNSVRNPDGLETGQSDKGLQHGKAHFTKSTLLRHGPTPRNVGTHNSVRKGYTWETAPSFHYKPLVDNAAWTRDFHGLPTTWEARPSFEHEQSNSTHGYSHGSTPALRRRLMQT